MAGERSTISPMQSFALSWKLSLEYYILKIGLLRTCCSRFPAVFPQMTAARKAGCCGDATGCWAALLSRQSEKCAACLGLMKTNGSRYWRHTSVSGRQKGIPFSGEMQLCQPEYPEPLGKDFLPWKWESGKVTPQLLQTIADQLRQCAPEQAADWCWLLGTRLVFTVLPLAKEALAALPQLERDAFFVQAEQFLRETATALGDQPQPLTEPNFEKLTVQYGKLLLVDSKEKLRRYARLYPTLACTKFPIRQKNGYVWLPEQPVRQSAKAASDGITLPEIRRELLLKQLQLPPEKIALEQVYPLCYEDMGFFSENGSHRKRGEDFLKEAPQLLQDYEAQHGKVLRERYSPEEWDWFRQAAD